MAPMALNFEEIKKDQQIVSHEQKMERLTLSWCKN